MSSSWSLESVWSYLPPTYSSMGWLVADGLTNREIGRRIFVSESTARFHVRNVMRKLGVHSRPEVAYAARKRGLLDEPLHQRSVI